MLTTTQTTLEAGMSIERESGAVRPPRGRGMGVS